MKYFKKIKTTFLISIFFAFTAFVAMPSAAAEIDFKDFKLVGQPAQYQILTRVEFKLSEYLKQALLNGVSLKVRVQFRLIKYQSWWFDKDVPLLTVSYRLKYQALSRHYLLSEVGSNKYWNFSTLPAAIRKLGELKKYNLPRIKASLNTGRYSLLAIADMAPETMRLPLRIQSLFSDKYKLSSDGIIWPLP